MMSKARMNDLATKRSRSVLEQMVRNSSKEVLKDERLAKVYSENGKIDFDKLIEANTSIYTFMEMLNTMQLEDFTEESVETCRISKTNPVGIILPGFFLKIYRKDSIISICICKSGIKHC